MDTHGDCFTSGTDQAPTGSSVAIASQKRDSNDDSEELKTQVRKRNALYSKKKYYKEKTEVEHLNGVKGELLPTNKLLSIDNARLEAMLHGAQRKVRVFESIASLGEMTEGPHFPSNAAVAVGAISLPAARLVSGHSSNAATYQSLAAAHIHRPISSLLRSQQPFMGTTPMAASFTSGPRNIGTPASLAGSAFSPATSQLFPTRHDQANPQSRWLEEQLLLEWLSRQPRVEPPFRSNLAQDVILSLLQPSRPLQPGRLHEFLARQQRHQSSIQMGIARAEPFLSAHLSPPARLLLQQRQHQPGVQQGFSGSAHFYPLQDQPQVDGNRNAGLEQVDETANLTSPNGVTLPLHATQRHAKVRKLRATTKQRKKQKVERSTAGRESPVPPLTAYNYYFRVERQRLLNAESLVENGDNGTDSHPLAWIVVKSSEFQESVLHDQWGRNPNKKRKHAKTHGRFSFGSLTTSIAKSWKALPAEIKEVFHGIAVRDGQRYSSEKQPDSNRIAT